MAHLETFLKTARTLIDTTLDQLIEQQPMLPYAHLFTAARYSLLSPAKRLRPLLVLATAQTYDVPLTKAILPACALEMVHTYSLIHDDLPCMDDDDLRRGKPTLHKVYPEGHAVLTGDYLLTYAFQLLSEAPHLSDTQKVALIHTLAKNAGGHGMIGGQVIDLSAENQAISWATLELMHSYKTASLLITSLEFGAIISHAATSDFPLLREIGAKMGLAFQLIDDLLDLTGSTEEMGKPNGSDQSNHKSTALSFLSPSQCQSKAQELIASGIQKLDHLSVKAPLLSELLLQLVDRRC